jgi:hypothetical protein
MLIADAVTHMPTTKGLQGGNERGWHVQQTDGGAQHLHEFAALPDKARGKHWAQCRFQLEETVIKERRGYVRYWNDVREALADQLDLVIGHSANC